MRMSDLMASQHHRLLVSNHLGRLFLMSESLENKAQLALDLLDTQKNDQKNAREKIARIQDHARQLASIVENAVPGAVSGLMREIETVLDEAFEKDAIQIRRIITDYVHQAPLSLAPYSIRLRETGIKKSGVPDVSGFQKRPGPVCYDRYPARNQHSALRTGEPDTGIFSIASGYLPIDPAKILLEPDPADETDMLIRLAAGQQESEAYVDVKAIKKILGLTLPDMILLPRYSGRIQTRVLTGMGLSFVTRFFDQCLSGTLLFLFLPAWMGRCTE